MYIIILSSLFLIYCTNDEENSSVKDVEKKEIQFNLHGKQIFEKYCDSCHPPTMTSEMTAPGLGGVLDKRGKDWTYRYTRDNFKMKKEGDSIALAYQAEGWSLMPRYNNLSDGDLDSLYVYIDQVYQIYKDEE